MRTRLAAKNTTASLLLQIVLAISGVLVPRFFTIQYGSAVNGLASSITQFISYMGLVEAGVSAAGTVALYAPLTQNKTEDVSAIVSTARGFYLRSGLLFVLLCAGLVLVYPSVVQQEIQDTAFVRMLIVILSVTGIVDYFYLGKFRILLLADQRGYVISVIQMIGTVITTALSIGLILVNASALLVKGSAALVYLLRSLAVGQYVRVHYPHISFHASPRPSVFSQRWAALLHQVIGMVVNNSAVVFMTLFLRTNALAEVSVYSVYSMVGLTLSGLMNAVFNGIGSGFGQVIAQKEEKVLRESFSTYEFLFFFLIFSFFCCMFVLLHPFVYLYSVNFADAAAYPRWELVALFTLAGLLQCIRLPGLTLICAAGHYKQTQSRAVLEAAINLVISAALIRPMGISGVMIGLCASYLYRTTDVILYSRKYILHGSLRVTGRRLGLNGIVFAALALIGLTCIPQRICSWVQWFGYAAAFGCSSCAVFGIVNFAAEKNQRGVVLARAMSVIKKQNSRG